MKKDILNALAAALTSPAPHEEVRTTWYMCVPDGAGNVTRYDTPNLSQVEELAHQWMTAGWPVWVEDDQGRYLHFAPAPHGLN